MMKILSALLLAAFAFVGSAVAQTSPNLIAKQVLTPAQWNQLFINKQDTLGYTAMNAAGGVFTGRVVAAAPGATTSGFNLIPGTTPAAPVNGDLWATSVGLFVQINGSTIGPLGVAACPTCAVTNLTNTFTALQKINLNAAALQSPLTGTALQIGNANTAIARLELDAYGNTGVVSCVRADGTAASPTAVQSGEELCSFNGWGHNGTAFVGGAARMSIFATQNWAVGSQGAKLVFSTTTNTTNTLVDRMTIDNDGSVTIGGVASQGVGTLNILGALYNNGVAPTGTGAHVLAISPSLTTPSLGVAIATSINGIAITASTGTLTLNTNTLNITGSGVNLSLAGVGTTTQTFPTTSATLARTDAGQTFTGTQIFSAITLGTINALGSSSGAQIWKPAAVSSGTITLPAGTVDFSATGGASQVVKQVSAGGIFTVGQLAFTDISGAATAGQLPLATNAAFGAVKPDTTTITVSGGVITAIGAVATSVQPGTTTVTGGTIGQCLGKGPSGNLLNQIACSDLTLADQTLSGGANVTPANLGTKTTGTATIDCGTSPLQWLINGGTFNIGAPALDGSCLVQVVNGSAASAVTLTGFSPQPTGFGDAFSTANTASGTATFTNASANITYTSTLAIGNLIYFTNSGGALPTNFTANTLYYVLTNSGTVLTVAATPGGTVITAGSAGTGTQTAHVPSAFDLSIARINASSVAMWKQVQ